MIKVTMVPVIQSFRRFICVPFGMQADISGRPHDHPQEGNGAAVKVRAACDKQTIASMMVHIRGIFLTLYTIFYHLQ
jgi:hypothetical protein